MDNIRLQQRVEDLELALIKIKSALESISQTDHSHITLLTFNDGYKNAANLALTCASIYIDFNLK